MAIRPTWSTGCYACRRRKVKCDEAKPECVKCKIKGQKCPGYRSTDEGVFRSMNASVAARVGAPTTTGPASIVSASFKLNIRPAINWEQYAVARFMTHFVEPASPDGMPGYLEILPQVFLQGCPSSWEALLAASMAHLANVSGMQQLQRESKVHYCCALRSLRAVLDDLASATTDSTLVAILLLQKFEVISGRSRIQGGPHEAGIAELIRLRSANPPTSNASQSLSQVVEIQKEIHSMNAPPKKPTLQQQNSTNSPSSIGPSLRMLFREVSVACAKLQSIISQVEEKNIPHESIWRPWRHALDVYVQLEFWQVSVPSDWKYKICPAPDIISLKDVPSNYRNSIAIFTSLQHGGVWVAYSCSRIHLSQSLLQGYRVLCMNPHIEPTNGGFDISEGDIWMMRHLATDDICFSASYMLGDVDEHGQVVSGLEHKTLGAFFLLRGLFVANAEDNLPLHQRRMLLHLLGRIGSEFGIKAAANHRGQWIACHGAEVEQVERDGLGALA